MNSWPALDRLPETFPHGIDHDLTTGEMHLGEQR
jgi:hypothetical protein